MNPDNQKWLTFELGSVGIFKNGANFNKTAYGPGLPIINVKQLYESRFVSSKGLETIADGAIKNPDRVMVQPGDILFARSSLTREGSGQCAQVPSGLSGALFSGFIIRYRIEKPNLLDPLFANYLLRSPVCREMFQRIASGSVISNLSQENLATLEIRVPCVAIQKRIGTFLDGLDTYAENLQKQNTTLEAIAQTLFKSWFVNFDPVHAKAAGETPEGMSPELAALFPSEFEEAELGLIPKGWRVESLDQEITYLNGLALQKFPAKQDGSDLPVLKIAQLRAGKTDPSVLANITSKPQYVVNDGEIIFSWSGSLEVEIWTGGACALNQHLFKVSSKKYSEWLCYLATKLHLDDFRSIAESKQTTMGHIQRHHLTEAKICLPPDSAMKELDRVLTPIHASIVNNAVSARALSELRDELLPRLISGKISIEEAGEAVAEVLGEIPQEEQAA